MKGVEFRSDTDSEVLAHLIAAMGGDTLEEAVRAALRLVTGTYGLVVLDAQRPETLVVARQGSPVILGIGDREMLVASDTAALVRHTRSIVHLDDGELAVLRADRYETSTLDGGATVKVPLALDIEREGQNKGAHAHFMEKEIHEQPEAIRRTLGGRLERRFSTAHLGGVEMSARELLEITPRQGARLRFGVHQRLRRRADDRAARAHSRARRAGLGVPLPQSGHRARYALCRGKPVRRDLRHARRGAGSHPQGRARSRHRECRRQQHRPCLRPRSSTSTPGPEIAVVSTKTFTCTAVAFALLALHLGRLRDLSTAHGERLVAALDALPDQVGAILAAQAGIAAVAAALAPCHDIYFIGRAAGYAVAMEGALKLKEVSYKHAEAYPASELKHGPLALIDAHTPTLVVLPRDSLLAKNLSTIEEIRARRGPVHVLTHPGTRTPVVDGRIEVPASEPELDPILLSVPLQMLAYRVAQACGTDIDQPRNLAKSVTVE